MSQVSGDILRTLVSPDAADLTEVEIPDLAPDFPESPHWISNWFLNSAFRARYRPPTHQRVAALLHRTDIVFSNYHLARDRTYKLIAEGVDRNPRRYLKAAQEWETCVLNIQMGMEIFKSMEPDWVQDDSDLKLHQMSNRIKHYGETTNKSVSDVDELILPLWFSNHGLVSIKSDARTRIEVSYSELANVVRAFAQIANDLQDPLGTHDAPT